MDVTGRDWPGAILGYFRWGNNVVLSVDVTPALRAKDGEVIPIEPYF